MKLLRAIINPITIAMTSFLVIYELTAITEDPVFKVGLFLSAVTIEIIIQYDLALGLAYLRLAGFKNKLKGCILLLFFSWYVVVFAILAGIGFFNAELSASVTAHQTAETGKNLTIHRIRQISDTIGILNKQLEMEAKTGYGPRSKMLVEQIDRLSSEQGELTTSLSKGQEKVKTLKNMFRGLSEVFGWSEEGFKILIFGTLIVILYLGQIITAWRVEIPVSVTSASPVVTNAIMEHMAMCQYCGDPFPARHNKKYCSDKCRQAAFRAKREDT